MNRSAVLIPLFLLSAPAMADDCRVLVNIEAKADNGTTPQVFDLTLGATPKAKVIRHVYATGKGGEIHLLRHRLNREYQTRTLERGKVNADQVWTTVMAQPAGGGVHQAKPVLNSFPSIGMPSDEDFGDGFYANHTARLMGIFNDHVSYSVSRGGFTGGVHEYDDSGWLTIVPPSSKPVHVGKLVGVAGIAAAQRALKIAVKVAEKEREEPFAEPPVVKAADDLKLSGFKLGTPGGIVLGSTLFCCTWAENHNLFELEAPLPQAPAGLASAVPDADGWFRGSCGEVRRHKGHLQTRVNGKVEQFPMDATGRLIGVAWVNTSAPAIALGGPDKPGHAEALESGRQLMAAKNPHLALEFFDAAKSLWPNHAATLSEAGWARFKANRHAGAKLDLKAALAATKTERAKGAIYYNLGRIAEDEGNFAAAKAHYAASLVARPGNKTVQKRLKAVTK